MRLAATCLVVVFFFVVLCHAQLHPPKGIWCKAAPLNNTLPTSAVQPVWWQEYFSYQATENKTINVRIYPAFPADEHTSVIIAPEYCPVFNDSYRYPNAFVPGVSSLYVPVVNGTTYIIFAHVVGRNFSLQLCDNECPALCPNECFAHGFCDPFAQTCNCTSPEWGGANCTTYINPNATAPGGRKVPFGSPAVFYTVVAGLPIFVAASIAVATTLIVRRKIQRKRMEQSLLLNPESDSDNPHHGRRAGGDGNAHRSGDEHSALNGHSAVSNGQNGNGHIGVHSYGSNGGANGTNGTNGVNGAHGPNGVHHY